MARDNPRRLRLGEQIQQELASLLRREVKDSRIGNITVTHVDISGDLREAQVFYLMFGRSGADPQVQRGLESASGFLRSSLSKSLKIKFTPTLKFVLDRSLEQGVRLTQLIESVNKKSGPVAGE
jgi:ribosome-binding factor A